MEDLIKKGKEKALEELKQKGLDQIKQQALDKIQSNPAVSSLTKFLPPSVIDKMQPEAPKPERGWQTAPKGRTETRCARSG